MDQDEVETRVARRLDVDLVVGVLPVEVELLDLDHVCSTGRTRRCRVCANVAAESGLPGRERHITSASLRIRAALLWAVRSRLVERAFLLRQVRVHVARVGVRGLVNLDFGEVGDGDGQTEAREARSSRARAGADAGTGGRATARPGAPAVADVRASRTGRARAERTRPHGALESDDDLPGRPTSARATEVVDLVLLAALGLHRVRTGGHPDALASAMPVETAARRRRGQWAAGGVVLQVIDN